MTHHLRKAVHADKDEIRSLIERSARGLSAGDYSAEQVEGALAGAFGVDSQLIDDQTYFVVERDGVLVGCGGWSRRRTLFGGDAHRERDAALLDPQREAARIRAFFVDPSHARQGIGTAILQRCEAAARADGFSSFELMATLPGVKLYAALGYRARHSIQYRLPSGLDLELVSMVKASAVI